MKFLLFLRPRLWRHARRCEVFRIFCNWFGAINCFWIPGFCILRFLSNKLAFLFPFVLASTSDKQLEPIYKARGCFVFNISCLNASIQCSFVCVWLIESLARVLSSFWPLTLTQCTVYYFVCAWCIMNSTRDFFSTFDTCARVRFCAARYNAARHAPPLMGDNATVWVLSRLSTARRLYYFIVWTSPCHLCFLYSCLFVFYRCLARPQSCPTIFANACYLVYVFSQLSHIYFTMIMTPS